MTSRETTVGARRFGLPLPRRVLFIGIIGAAALAAYAGSFHSPLFFDDLRCLGENPSLRNLWALDEVLAPPPRTMLGSRPLSNLSFALNYALGGLNVTGYHVFNFALHLAAALVLAGLARRTLVRAMPAPASGPALDPTFWIAVLAAAGWGAHPLLVSAASYISQRTEVLMGLCYLLTLYAFARGAEQNRRGWLLLSVAACAAGMMAKEVMVTAPLAALWYDRTFFSGSFRSAWNRRRTYYAALAATWLLLALLMHRGLDPQVGTTAAVTSWDYALVQCQALALYVTRAVWPQPLAFDYGEITLLGFSTAARFFWAPLLLIGGAIYGCVRRSAAGFCVGWILLTLAPTSSFVPISFQPIAENRTYLPVAGFMVLTVAGLWQQVGRRSVVIMAVVVPAWIALSLQRNAVFRDPITTWADAARTNPMNARAQNNLAVALQGVGRRQEAEKYYRRAVELKPYSSDVRSSYAWLLMQEARYQEAITQGLEAVRITPDFALARSNLGGALLASGRTTEGLEQLKAALDLEPSLVPAHYNLALALSNAGKPAAALPHYAAVFRSGPGDASLRYQYGNALFSLGRRAEALRAYESSLALRADQPDVHLQIGVCYFGEGRWPEAAGAFQEAVRLKPDLIDARYNLALAWERMGRQADAVREFEAILRVNPQHQAAQGALEHFRRSVPPSK